jgi:hypothetical protein
MKVAETIVSYDAWRDMFGFDLWGEFGEDNEVYHDDPKLEEYINHGRVVSLVQYEADCNDACTEDDHSDTCPYVYEDNDFVMRGWAMVDVIRRVVLPLGWREPEFEKWEVPA